MGSGGAGEWKGRGGEWSHLQQAVLEISMVCPLYRYCGFFRVSSRRASRVCGFFRFPEVIRGLGGCRWRVGVVLLSLRSRSGGVWSIGGGMDHNWVVQYVVMETFGVPSLLVSGVEKSRLKRG